MAYDRQVNGIAITETNRFSNYVREKDKAGLKDLERWIQHFKASGVDAVIGFTRQGFAVYRVGLEDCPED